MNIYLKSYLVVALIGQLFTPKNSFTASLDGTTSFVYKNQHHVFSDGESARGFVRMGNGFTIKAGARATLDTLISVSGSIDLRENGILQLVSDLKLDSGLTWSSGGYINGRKNAIILNDKLTIPATKSIHVVGDTVIDGGMNATILLGTYANISVENNATLTLRNLIIKNTYNNILGPCLKVTSAGSKLVLDNVTLAMNNDMTFGRGQLYIHNNVVFTGTSSFIYTSIAPCFIAPQAKLTFDMGTTFSFAPASSVQDLFVLQDRTSSLHLNGCNLKITTSGMRMTKGKLIFENKVNIETNAGGGIVLSRLKALTSKPYCTAAGEIEALAWHPTGTMLALGGDSAIAVGPFPAGNELHIYSFDGSTLTPFTSRDYSVDGNEIESIAWHPSGNVLAIAGDTPLNTAEFPNNNEVRLYQFNNATLTPLTSVDYGNRVRHISWNPLGTTLMVGGQGPTTSGGFTASDDLRLYSFNGSTLTPLVGKQYGPALYCSTWNPTGNIIAIGGNSPVNNLATTGFANTDELRLYALNGSTLTALTSQDYGTTVRTCAWNPDGTVLAVGGEGPISGAGGFANTHELRLYSFNGSTLTPLTSIDFSSAAGGYIGHMEWNPDGTILAAGGRLAIDGNEIHLYSFNGSDLTSTFSVNYGSPNANDHIALSWNKDGKVLAFGTGVPVSGQGSLFNNTDPLRLYALEFNQINISSPQALSRSLVFGNSSLGSNYDLSVEILGGAHITIDGKVVDDSA